MYNVIYDLETYPNCFLFGAYVVELNKIFQYELSDHVCEIQGINWFIEQAKTYNMKGVGFNNCHFDYPILHHGYKGNYTTSQEFYDMAQRIIDSDNRFEFHVWDNKRLFEQIDLYLIHHFDNRARSTSLKAIEFALGMESIKELPYKPGTILTYDQIQHLKQYHKHDLHATFLFYQESKEQIQLREDLKKKWGLKCTNWNDAKIGEELIIKRIEEKSPGSCYIKQPGSWKKTKRQTTRAKIHLKDCIYNFITFERPEFQNLVSFLQSKTITETKGVFEDLNVTIDGFKFVFGLGGIHGSIESSSVFTDEDGIVIDIDAASYYPMQAEMLRIAPEHLGSIWCDVLAEIRAERKTYDKGTSFNKSLKLSGNGAWGKSGSAYSCFFDQLYTMTTTISGQLMLCMLAEQIMKIPHMKMIQANTDGLTVKIPHAYLTHFNNICAWWEGLTKMILEHNVYKAMYIRDVNNYIAVPVKGKVKLKGTYVSEVEYHKDPSQLVVAKIAEKVILNGGDIYQELINHQPLTDFFIRAKVRRQDQLFSTLR